MAACGGREDDRVDGGAPGATPCGNAIRATATRAFWFASMCIDRSGTYGHHVGIPAGPRKVEGTKVDRGCVWALGMHAGARGRGRARADRRCWRTGVHRAVRMRRVDRPVACIPCESFFFEQGKASETPNLYSAHMQFTAWITTS
jgi:hypothetical protein